jgi:hypothetical protein
MRHTAVGRATSPAGATRPAKPRRRSGMVGRVVGGSVRLPAVQAEQAAKDNSSRSAHGDEMGKMDRCSGRDADDHLLSAGMGTATLEPEDTGLVASGDVLECVVLYVHRIIVGRCWEALLAPASGSCQHHAYRTRQSPRHTGRQRPPEASAREAWVVVGRRGGKSRVAALVAVWLACFNDYRAMLAPGEPGTLMVIAADRRQARSSSATSRDCSTECRCWQAS